MIFYVKKMKSSEIFSLVCNNNIFKMLKKILKVNFNIVIIVYNNDFLILSNNFIYFLLVYFSRFLISILRWCFFLILFVDLFMNLLINF